MNEPVYWTEKVTKESVKGDVLMSVRAPVGPVNINPFDKICIGRGLNALRVSEKILNDYLFYYLKTNQEQIAGNDGVIFQSISRDQILALKIPLPPLNIQDKIVKEIQKIDKIGIEIMNKLIDLKKIITDKFIESKFHQKNLGDITEFKNGLNYSRTSVGEKIDIVGVKDFKNRFSPDLDSLDKIQIDGKLSEEYHLKNHDILVVRSNGSANLVGRFLFIDHLKSKTSFSGFTIRIRPNSEIVNAKYLCYFLRTELVREKLTGNSKGSNIKSLNQTLLASVKVPLPSVSEQEKVVAEIEKIEQQILGLEKSISQIQQKKDEVLRKYLV